MQRIKEEKIKLVEKLTTAQKLVQRVMEEGGSLLDKYHLDSNDIDFGVGSVDERITLGEGA